MSDIVLNAATHCPFLKLQNGRELVRVSIDPKTEIADEGAVCIQGGEKGNEENAEVHTVKARVVSDLYIAKKTVAIELHCEGCTNLPEGFTKVVRERLG